MAAVMLYCFASDELGWDTKGKLALVVFSRCVRGSEVNTRTIESNEYCWVI